MKAETTLKPKIELVKTKNRVPPFVMPLVKFAIFSADAGLAILSFALAFRLRENSAIFSPAAWSWSKDFAPYAGILIFVVPVRLIMFAYQRAYRLHGAFSYVNEFIKIFKAVAVASLLIIAFTFLFRGGFAFREFSYSRGVFAFDFIIALVVFSAFHLGLRRIQTSFRRRDINLIPTLIVGTNAEAEQTIRELKERTDLGYRVVGIITTEKHRKDDKNFSDKKIVGMLGDLPDVIRQLEIQEVIITDASVPGEILFEAMMSVGRK
ncbi:MAG: nucleoside-diphosphate sugar epimerase/dehydratase, partial [Pyrinomonadaceae bacterium]